MTKRFIPFLVLAALVMPSVSLAANVENVRVVEHTDTQAVMKRTTLTSEEWFTCEFATRACTAAQANTTVVPPGSKAQPAFMTAYRALMPAGASWLTRSPDGRYIAFYIASTQTRNKRTFGIMDTTDLKIYTKEETLSYWDLLTEGVTIFAFSPDSKTLVYISDSKDNPTLYKVELAKLTGKSTALPTEKMFAKEYTVADVIWKDSDTLLFTANREGPHLWALYEYALSTGALKKVASNVSYGYDLRKVGEKYLYAIADKDGVRPALYDALTRTSGTFTFPTSPGSLTSDGKSVKLAGGLSGVYLLESSKKSDTLLVWLHGGPFRQTSAGYHPYLSYDGYDWVLETARRADAGVLKIDYPGSYGYGRKFAESISGKVGVKDGKDTAAAIADFAKRNGYTKVYLMGNSYGGYLALKLLVDKPSAYKGAFSINGVTDWTTMLTALDTSIFNVQFFGTVGEGNYDIYANSSVYNKVGDLTTQKVILMHGDKDLSVPYSQSKGLATYLTSLNKNVEFITFAGEDHVYKKPESFETLCKTTLSFIGRGSAQSCEL